MKGFEVVWQVFGVFGRLLGRVFGALVGPMTWRPPRWALWACERGRVVLADARRRPARAALLALGAIALIAGGGYALRWWNGRPRPTEIAVTVAAPPATPVEERAHPLPAVVSFSASVAPMSALGKPVTSGVELSPRIDGVWRWRNDHELAFEPQRDWPVGQHFRVRLGRRGLVPERIRLDTDEVEFDSAPFAVEVSDKAFYQDPVDPTMKKVVLTYSFSHPVDPASFEKAVHLTLVPGTKQDKEVAYKAQVSFDKLRGKAFVHSAPIDVPQHDATMRIVVDRGVHAKAGGPAVEEPILCEIAVPGLFNFLKVSSTQIQVVDSARNEPEQILVIETTAGVSEAEMKRSIEAWVLPVYDPAEPNDGAGKKRPHRWNDPERVDEALLKQAQQLTLEPLAVEHEFSTTHSFKLKAEVGRYVYVHVKKGLRAFGGYLLADPALSIVKVPAFPRQLRILHSGSLLSLSGEKKVSVFARDVPGLRIEVARVLPDQLHHLVTQGAGEFSNPRFGYRFDLDNATERMTEDKRLATPGRGKPVYEAIDLESYLGTGEGRRGVFFLKVHAWDPDEKRDLGEEDSRLVVLTDLGLLVKQNEDDTRDVFVASIHGGEPLSGVKLQVLGKNGLPVASAVTDGEGHAHFSSLRDLHREKMPVMLLAQKGRDSSFLPLSGSDRWLDLSRFDTGGVSSGEQAHSLSAYVFSDRGIYRPGEEIRAGVIVRANDWRTSLEGVPIELTIDDARGMAVKKQRVRLPASGLVELEHATPEVAPTGTYTVNAYLVKDGRPDRLLGSTTVRVREFLPDKMKIAVHFSTERPGEGWVSPERLGAKVSLTNLYGAPAEGRVVRAQMSLSPAIPSFPTLRDFNFFDPLLAKEAVSEVLSEAKTDDKGEASLDLQLQRYKPATYRLSLLAEGLEEGSGRGVSAEAQIMVSPMQFLVGYKADGDLGYVSKGAARKIELVAVGPSGEKIAQPNLHTVLFERKYVSVLTKQPNGTYKYESVRRLVEIARKALTIGKDGVEIALTTERPGDFTLAVRNDKDLDLQKIDFTVAGTANLTRSMEKNAELGMQLRSRDVEPGQNIEMQLKAPYTGSGLITIERDRVYAWKWFRSTTSASVQTMKVPEGLEGGGYVSVSYLRDAGSDDVFSSPLSYAIAPFSISREKRKVRLSVELPDRARPGETLSMKVKADRPTKAVVFAVDEGILRVADYKTPDPLGFFFQKRALGVRTLQILDLVLPEFSRLMAAVAPGGDAEGAIGANLNPFKRRHDRPVVYWSGVVDVGPAPKTLGYELPDTWNGTLRVMAIAVEPQAIGVAEHKILVRGDYVVSPSLPLAVAPGDDLELVASVTNNVDKAGARPDVEISLEVTPGLEVIGPKKQSLSIAPMREGRVAFRLRATDKLGAATATLVASGAGKPARVRSELSVRPAVPYTVTFAAGHLRDEHKTVGVPRVLYPEYRELTAGVSRLPLGLTHGLVGYLEKFPHGCTEQITSQAIPAIALRSHAEFGISGEAADKAVHRWIDLVRARQNDDGAFGLWAASPKAAPLPSVWTLLALVEAKDRGVLVPVDMLKAGEGYLQGLAANEGETLADERLRGMAIYVLTRMGRVTTSYASALKKRLDADFAKTWKQDLVALYLGSTLALLKQTDKARALIEGVRIGVGPTETDWSDLLDPLARDAQIVYLTARHFPDRAAQLTQAQLDKLVEPIFQGQYNTYSSAFTILALESYGKLAGKGDAEQGALTVSEALPSGKRALSLSDSLLPLARYSPDATSLDFGAKGDFGAYWLLEQRGFDRVVPDKALSHKVEVFREYTDATGKPLDKIALGEELYVHVRVRGLGQEPIPNLAIVDLLPGGFEVVLQEPPRGGGEEEGGEDEPHGRDDAMLPIAVSGSTMSLEFGDVREDRVVLYTTATNEIAELVYQLKAAHAGTYRVAPVLADSMYDRSVLGRSTGGSITVFRK